MKKKIDTSGLVEQYKEAMKVGNDGLAELLIKQIQYVNNNTED